MSVLNKPPVRLEGILRMEKISVLASHILVILMMGCVGLTITQVALRLIPDRHMGYYPWLCMLLALEALVAVRTTRRQSDMESSPLLYILIQLVLIFLVVKLFIYFWE